MQYLAITIVLEWASVLRVVEVHGTDEEQSEEIALAKSEARECFSHCRLYLSVAEEQLSAIGCSAPVPLSRGEAANVKALSKGVGAAASKGPWTCWLPPAARVAGEAVVPIGLTAIGFNRRSAAVSCTELNFPVGKMPQGDE